MYIYIYIYPYRATNIRCCPLAPGVLGGRAIHCSGGSATPPVASNSVAILATGVPTGVATSAGHATVVGQAGV